MVWMNIQLEHSSKLSLMIFTKWMMFNEVPKHPRICILDKIRLNSNKDEGPLLLSNKFSPPFEFPRNIYQEIYIRVNSRNFLSWNICYSFVSTLQNKYIKAFVVISGIIILSTTIDNQYFYVEILSFEKRSFDSFKSNVSKISRIESKYKEYTKIFWIYGNNLVIGQWTMFQSCKIDSQRFWQMSLIFFCFLAKLFENHLTPIMSKVFLFTFGR